MILDSSAAVAILLSEPDAAKYASAIAAAGTCAISAANYFEASIVVEYATKGVYSRDVDYFFNRASITIVPVTAEHASLARQAYFDYGKGQHKARLNFGDCFAFALAKATGEPLLFKGSDFSKTDITPALV